MTVNTAEEQPKLLCSRTFQPVDQQRFAHFSGDGNPMHMDALAARRTQAGAVVVHGMHQALWALNEVWRILPEHTRIRRIRMRFPNFLLLNESARLSLLEQDEKTIRLSITAHETVTTNIVLKLEAGHPWTEPEPTVAGRVATPGVPKTYVELDELVDLSGEMNAWASGIEAQELFPQASSTIGANRVNAIAALSRLVGMVSPGLHSIFSAIDVELHDKNSTDLLDWRVTSIDRRFSFVRERVSGMGIDGEIEAFLRKPPTAQLSSLDIARAVEDSEFRGKVAMVVGASRGLGEFTAKTIAAGGGHVIATYHVGQADCERIAVEIRASGGSIETLQYDASKPPAEQLESLTVVPTSIYYFATTRIFTRAGKLYDSERFREFVDVYIDGFYNLCTFVRQRTNGHLSIFYPSSIFVEDRPSDMTAYSMAKAAGEVLCADMERFWPSTRVLVSRLPRQETDQTATIVAAEVFPKSVQQVLLPLIRQLEESSDSKTEMIMQAQTSAV